MQAWVGGTPLRKNALFTGRVYNALREGGTRTWLAATRNFC